MNLTSVEKHKIGKQLILDELFDYCLYRRLTRLSRGKLRTLLDAFVKIESEHYAFWQEYFGMQLNRLDFYRRVKLHFLFFFCRVFGERSIHLVLESIEVYGIRKYLTLWKKHHDSRLTAAVKKILQDELEHEERILSQFMERKIHPERVRNIFLGFNDGLVEILGAVSGFYAAFGNTGSVFIAGVTVAVAGSLSMAAGAFVATNSENEVERIQKDKDVFLGKALPVDDGGDSPLVSAFTVGVFYFFGAILPVVPVILGARTVLASVLCGVVLIFIVSMALSFLSGMDAKKRLLTNLVIIAAAVSVSYFIGTIVKTVFGISV